MIVCTRCGFENEDTDAFCGSCAGFLEWEGKKVVEEAPPPLEPEVEPEPVPDQQHGFIDRVKDKIGLGEDRESGAAATGATAGSAVATEVVAPEPEAPPPPPPTPGPVSAPVRSAGGIARTSFGDTPAVEESHPEPEAQRADVEPAAPVESPDGRGNGSADAVEKPADAGEKPADAVEKPADAVEKPAETAERPSTPASTQPVPAPPSAPAGPAAAATVQTAEIPAASTPTAAPASAPTEPAQPDRPVAPISPAPVAAAAAAATMAAPAVGAAPPGPGQPAAVHPGATPPSAVQPGAVQPGAARRPPPTKKAAPSRVVNPGDKVCGQCGEGNDPVRKFCRRCGASLVEAVVYTLPWYKRWWQRITQPKQRAAGERPKNRRRAFGGSGPGWLGGTLAKVIVIAVIVVIVLAFVGPFHRPIRNRVTSWYHDIHPTYTQVHPTVALASSSSRGHPPMQLIDGLFNTSWQAGNARPVQLIVLQLPSATNVGRIGFLSGDQDTTQSFLTQPRPRTVKVTLNGTSGQTKTITLKDEAAFQTFGFGSKGTTKIDLTIESVYPSTGGGNNVSVAEIETYSKN